MRSPQAGNRKRVVSDPHCSEKPNASPGCVTWRSERRAARQPWDAVRPSRSRDATPARLGVLLSAPTMSHIPAAMQTKEAPMSSHPAQPDRRRFIVAGAALLGTATLPAGAHAKEALAPAD